MSSQDWLPPPPPSPPSPSRRGGRSRTRGVVVALAVALVVAAATVVVGSFLIGDDAELSGSDLADAYMSFERAIEYGDDGYAELSRCPVGDPVALASVVADVVDVDPSILSGETFVDAYVGISGYPAITQCFLSSDPDDGFGPTAVGFSVSAVPVGSYRDFLTDDAYDMDVDVTIEVQRRWSDGGLDGDLFAYCYRADDLSGCGADLVDRYNGVVLSVYLQGPGRSGDEVVSALEAVVRRMASDLLRFVDENPVPPTVPVTRGDQSVTSDGMNNREAGDAAAMASAARITAAPV